MKLYFTYSAVLFVFCFKLSAQMPPSYYNQTFGILGRNELINGILELNGFFYINSSNGTINTPNQLDLRKLDNNGNVLNYKNVNFPNKSFGLSIAKQIYSQIDSTFYIAGSFYEDYFGGNSASHAILIKLNSNLDTMWHKTYVNTNDSSIIITGSILVDTCIILYGQTKEVDTNGDAFIIKTDLNGNEIFRRKYPITNRFGGFTKLIHTRDNYFVGIENILDFPSWGYSNIKVTKYDSLFNLIWSQSYGTPYLDYLGDLIELSDGDFVFSQGLGISQNTPPWGAIQCRGTLTKINNINGGIIWQQSYGDTRVDVQMYGVLERDNKLFVLGFTATSCAPEVKPNCTHISYMLVADSNGDSLNYATIFPDSISAWDYLYDLAPTDDGFLCVGSAQIFNGAWDQQNWVAKADTNGCFNTDCAQGIGIKENSFKESNILMFPNPSNSILNIKLPFLLNLYDDSKEIVIYDEHGKIVIKKVVTFKNFSLDISDLLNGIYFMTITNGGIVILKDKFIKTEH